jgi:hypothetical protein
MLRLPTFPPIRRLNSLWLCSTNATISSNKIELESLKLSGAVSIEFEPDVNMICDYDARRNQVVDGRLLGGYTYAVCE